METHFIRGVFSVFRQPNGYNGKYVPTAATASPTKSHVVLAKKRNANKL